MPFAGAPVPLADYGFRTTACSYLPPHVGAPVTVTAKTTSNRVTQRRVFIVHPSTTARRIISMCGNYPEVCARGSSAAASTLWAQLRPWWQDVGYMGVEVDAKTGSEKLVRHRFAQPLRAV